MRSVQSNILIFLSVFLLASCGSMAPPAPPQPNELIAPLPREDSEGKYLSPYTSDGVVAEWVKKGKSAQMGAT